MGFPDRIERTVQIAHPPARVWAALTTAEGLGAWFGDEATIELPGRGGVDAVEPRARGADAGGAGGGAGGVRLHLALLAEAGLVTAEPGERRRVRCRLRSAPMQVAQQFLAALARDWDTPLRALAGHPDRTAREPATPPPHPTGEQDG
jgi:Polyketide cyclase / dehydrase and lipid transport